MTYQSPLQRLQKREPEPGLVTQGQGSRPLPLPAGPPSPSPLHIILHPPLPALHPIPHICCHWPHSKNSAVSVPWQEDTLYYLSITCAFAWPNKKIKLHRSRSRRLGPSLRTFWPRESTDYTSLSTSILRIANCGNDTRCGFMSHQVSMSGYRLRT